MACILQNVNTSTCPIIKSGVSQYHVVPCESVLTETTTVDANGCVTLSNMTVSPLGTGATIVPADNTGQFSVNGTKNGQTISSEVNIQFNVAGVDCSGLCSARLYEDCCCVKVFVQLPTGDVVYFGSNFSATGAVTPYTSKLSSVTNVITDVGTGTSRIEYSITGTAAVKPICSTIPWATITSF